MKRGWESVLDQQHLRSELNGMGLVCFIGDGTRPARSYTRHRSWHRVAGPKDGVHIPFHCPVELSPVEVMLAGSNQTVTGLGIKRERSLQLPARMLKENRHYSMPSRQVQMIMPLETDGRCL